MAQIVKNVPSMWEIRVRSLGREDTLEKYAIPGEGLQWQSTAVFWPGEVHGQRSLEGYSERGPKESDMTERLTCTHIESLSRSKSNTVAITIRSDQSLSSVQLFSTP